MINVADKLKSCPRGYILYSPLFGNVVLDSVIISPDKPKRIRVIATAGDGERAIHELVYEFDEFGRYFSSFENSECMLYPSKEERSWHNFIFLEKGHVVLVSRTGIDWVVRKYIRSRSCSTFNGLTNDWPYIVPYEKFNFEDIESNINNSIV